MDFWESLVLKQSEPPAELNLAQSFGELPVRLEIELGCGKGRFLAARALAYPETSFLGIDKKMARVRKTARKAFRAGLSNVRLLCAEARSVIFELLPAESVACYYVFFPDPWPKRRHHRRRLFDSEFVAAIHRTLLDGGGIHIITDHADYFRAISKAISGHAGFSETAPMDLNEEERTEFQIVFQNQNAPIHACSFEKT